MKSKYHFILYWLLGLADGNTYKKSHEVSMNLQNPFMSSTNLSVFYRLMRQRNQFVNVGFRISAGTNLYSDWDQFKRYAWIGLGLEIGFGEKTELIKSKTP